MQVRIKRKNVGDRELAKALTGLIRGEGIEMDVIDRLSKHEHQEPIPEMYIRTIVERLNRSVRAILASLQDNVSLWFAAQANVPKRTFLRKADDPRPPFLTDEQIDELRRLIEAHFRVAIGISVTTPKTWQKAGIELPDDDLNRWLTRAYVAGRLAEVLDNGSSYGEMMKLAKKLRMSRLDQLVLEAAKQNAGKYIKGYGRKLADVAEDVLVQNHKASLQSIVQKYFSGELKHTTYNDQGFTPAEVEQMLSTNKEVRGWKELATELKNRFKAADIGRDWDRIAVSEVRFATNLGRLVNIQVEGGGDPEDIEVYYHVQSTACKYCKELYLEPDGTPKIFKLSEIMNNVMKTGGMQTGLRAGLIGEEGGWVANALCHPWGHCYPVRKKAGYDFVPVGGGPGD
ncbi:hypothetical protein SD70_02430 [Gordoniibacillus kamchatkensis]|uniref:Uncharacterized protein n=1 Tax=Gordoniibacillus kamchatkensis TaxID=1590651 RepID=A0ABR5AM21_9BACL|nr:hypothetical protein [Paenibacillus sp. VKM B-2647]KIL42061.1 hypothetical protein SD70_02430 [Paenibacillus sp. VKM B-2647]